MLTLLLSALALRAGRPVALAAGPTSKGIANVALVELGSGCCHGDDVTKAAVRACDDAIEWTSIKVRTIIPGSYDAMRLHVQLAVPNPDELDLDAVAECFPYGQLLPIAVERGGLLASSRAGLPADEPPEALMTVAVACVTVGWGDPDDEESADSTTEASRATTAKAPPPNAEAADAGVDDATAAAASADRSKLGEAPSVAEMTPASPEMLARAAAANAAWSDRVLTPYEAFAYMGDEEDIEVIDVRTAEQRQKHSINGQVGLSVKGAQHVPLDDLVSGEARLPPADAPLLLVCSKGPKSLVALDYLARACPRAMCVEGGVVAWDAAKLPTEKVL